MSISRSRPMTRSPKSVTFFDGSNDRGCVNSRPHRSTMNDWNDAEEPERRDEPRQARRVAEQRHHGVGEQAEPDADERARWRRRAAVGMPPSRRL